MHSRLLPEVRCTPQYKTRSLHPRRKPGQALHLNSIKYCPIADQCIPSFACVQLGRRCYSSGFASTLQVKSTKIYASIHCNWSDGPSPVLTEPLPQTKGASATFRSSDGRWSRLAGPQWRRRLFWEARWPVWRSLTTTLA